MECVSSIKKEVKVKEYGSLTRAAKQANGENE
jgi:hypothetical protein